MNSGINAKVDLKFAPNVNLVCSFPPSYSNPIRGTNLLMIRRITFDVRSIEAKNSLMSNSKNLVNVIICSMFNFRSFESKNRHFQFDINLEELVTLDSMPSQDLLPSFYQSD